MANPVRNQHKQRTCLADIRMEYVYKWWRGPPPQGKASQYLHSTWDASEWKVRRNHGLQFLLSIFLFTFTTRQTHFRQGKHSWGETLQLPALLSWYSRFLHPAKSLNKHWRISDPTTWKPLFTISIANYHTKSTDTIMGSPKIPPISGLTALEPRPGGQWTINEHDGETSSLSYVMDNGAEAITYTLRHCHNEDDIRKNCASFVYEYNDNGMAPLPSLVTGSDSF